VVLLIFVIVIVIISIIIISRERPNGTAQRKTVFVCRRLDMHSMAQVNVGWSVVGKLLLKHSKVSLEPRH
jgi:hypothetical protein